MPFQPNSPHEELSVCPLANHEGKFYQSDADRTLFVMSPLEHLAERRLNYVTYCNRFYCIGLSDLK